MSSRGVNQWMKVLLELMRSPVGDHKKTLITSTFGHFWSESKSAAWSFNNRGGNFVTLPENLLPRGRLLFLILF